MGYTKNQEQLNLNTDGTIPTNTIANGAVDGTKIASNAVDLTKLVAKAVGTSVGTDGVAYAGSSGTVSLTSTTRTTVTNQSVTITTTGRPVICFISLQGNVSQATRVSTNGNVNFYLLRGSTTIGVAQYSTTTGSITSYLQLLTLDQPSAGAHTYSLEYAISAGVTATASGIRLTVLEL